MNKEQGTMTKRADAPLPANTFEDDMGKGLGEIGQKDLALPFLKILAQLSPEVNKRDGKYVEGAEAGMIYNSVTGELYNGVEALMLFQLFINLNILNGRIEEKV